MNVKDESADVDNSVTHEFHLIGNNEATSPVVMKIRELPITRADNPFGNEEAPENDTTGTSTFYHSVLCYARL